MAISRTIDLNAMNMDVDMDTYIKPVPRDPKSPTKQAEIITKNRRREYLQRHPSYFTDIEHELADPNLYERFIKRFQTPAERDAEGKMKGYGRTLEASLLKSETRLSAPNSNNSNKTCCTSSAGGVNDWDNDDDDDDDDDVTPETKAQGQTLWYAFLEDRFVGGQDEEFDYEIVDRDEDLDALARRDEEEGWFESEEPGWAGEEDDDDGGGGGTEERELKCETGMQDF